MFRIQRGRVGEDGRDPIQSEIGHGREREKVKGGRETVGRETEGGGVDFDEAQLWFLLPLSPLTVFSPLSFNFPKLCDSTLDYWDKPSDSVDLVSLFF